MRAGRFVLGVSSASAYGELAWAEEGSGAYLNDKPIRVSATAELSAGILSTGNLRSLARSPQWRNLGQLIGRISRIRGYGDFLHYHLLSRGALDAVIESDVSILDIAALSVIVREAGGAFTDLGGGQLTLATTSALASNGRLHAPLMAALAWGGTAED
jgi:histidinol-phosphatase